MKQTPTQASTPGSPVGSRTSADSTPQASTVGGPAESRHETVCVPGPVLASVGARDARAMRAKGRSHSITPASDGSCFLVVSGSSGKAYRVTPISGGALCSCAWGEHHKGTACSHVLACYAWAAEQQGLGLSAWATPAAAARQHRPAQVVADVVVTLRGRS